MKTHDKQGRPYAKLSELRVGMQIELDNGFDCIHSGLATVHKDGTGFYFSCTEGEHYLEGQADDGEHLVGVYNVLPVGDRP